MADSDKILSLAIQLGVIGKEDATALRDLLGETKTAAGDLNSSMPENLAGWQNYKKGMVEAGEGAEGVGEKMHGLRALMAGAGPEAREFGHLLHFALNPTMLFGASSAAGLELYFKWLEKCQEKQREMILDLQKFNDFQHRVIAAQGETNELMLKQVQALSEARVQATGLAHEIQSLEGMQKLFDESARNAVEDRISAQSRENSLLTDKIGLLEALRKISPTEAEQEKLASAHKEKVDAINAKLAEKKNEADLAQGHLDDFKNVIAAKVPVAGDANSGYSVTPETIAQMERIAAEAKGKFEQAVILAGGQGGAEVNRLNAQIEENRNLQKKYGTEYDPATGQLRGPEYQRQIDELEKQKRTLVAQIAAATPELQQLSDTATAYKEIAEQLKTANSKFEELHRTVVEKRNAYDHDRMQATRPGGELATENLDYLLKALAELVKSKGGEMPVQIAREGINSVYNNRNDEHAQSLRELLRATGFTNAQIIAILNGLVSHHLDVQTVLMAIMQRVAALEASAKSVNFTTR